MKKTLAGLLAISTDDESRREERTAFSFLEFFSSGEQEMLSTV